MANPVLDRLLNEYQSLGVAPSTRRTYRAGVRSYQQFCDRFNIQQFPATSLTLCYFCTSIAQRVSYKTIKVYLAGMRLEHLERELHDPTDDRLLQLLCSGIERSQGTTTHSRLPITIDLLRSLKTQLRNDASYSLLERGLLWSAFTLAFYGFLRASEFTSSSLQWSDIQFSTTTITIDLRQSKTDPFRRGHTIAIRATSTSTCPVRAINCFAEVSTLRSGSLHYGGRFTPLSRDQLTEVLRHLLQQAGHQQHLYSSHSFRIGAATTAAAAGLPAWLIKSLGRWSSDAYQRYIQCPPETLRLIPSLLARADTSKQTPWNPYTN